MYLQELRVEMSQHQRNVRRRALPDIVRWLRCCLLVMLACNCFMPPTLAFADSPPVTQEIRYQMAEAGEVFLVWGVNGWSVVPEEMRPAGTVVEYEVMHTPMVREGDTFVIKVQVPSGAALDYGFQIRRTREGVAISWVWDGDYRVVPSHDGVIEVQAELALEQVRALANQSGGPLVAQEIRYQMPEAGEVFLVWGVNGWNVVPEEIRPAGTEMKDRVMHTPMAREDGVFVATVQVPSNATVDYVFIITRARRGAVVKVVDANGNPKRDYHTVAVQGGVAEVQAPLSLRKHIAVRDLEIALPWLGIIFLAGVCVISSAMAAHRRFITGAGRNHFLLRIKNIIWKRRLLLTMAFISVLYLGAINTDLYIWGDNAHYIIVGKSIATGQGFRDILYPEKPPFNFPIPVFPLLLSPFVYFFDYNLLPMKIFVSIMSIGAIYLVYRLFRDLLDENLTILLMLFVGVSPHIVSFSHQVMSEVPYLVFSMLSLLCVMKYGSEERWLTRTGVISALVITVTCLTKTLGIALVLASIPYLLLASAANKSQGVKKVCLLISVCASVWTLCNYTIVTDNEYIYWFLAGTSGNSSIISAGPQALVVRILTSLKAFGRAVPETVFYCTAKAPSVILAILSLFLLGYGFFYCLLKRKTILEYYVLSYFFILLPFEPTRHPNVQRYVVPMIPFLLYYFMQGLRQLGFWISRFGRSRDDHSAVRNPAVVLKSAFGNTRNITSAFICVLVLLNLNSVLQASILRTRIETFEYWVFDDWLKYNNMALWTKEHTPPESAVITTKAYNFHILSHRAVYWYPHIDPDADEEEILRTILRMNADYIALDDFAIKYSLKKERAIADTVQQNQDMFQLVYQDGHNGIYHILPRARPATSAPPLQDPETSVTKYFDGRDGAMALNFDTELYLCGLIHSWLLGYDPSTAASRAQDMRVGWHHIIEDCETYGIPVSFNICGHEAVFGDTGISEVAGIDAYHTWHSDPRWSTHTWYSDLPASGGNYQMTGDLSGYIQSYGLVYGGDLTEQALNSAVPFEISYHNFGHESLGHISDTTMDATFRLGVEYHKRIGSKIRAETPPWDINPQASKYPIYLQNGIFVFNRSEGSMGEPYEVIEDLWIVPRSSPFNADSDLTGLIDSAIRNGAVLAHYSHPEDGFESTSRSGFQNSLTYARSKVDSGELWATTLSEIGRYWEAKSDVSTVTQIVGGKTVVDITLTDYDVALYGIPYLTFKSIMPDESSYAKITVDYPSTHVLNSDSSTVRVVGGEVIYTLYLNPTGVTHVEIGGMDVPFSDGVDINEPVLTIDSTPPADPLDSTPITMQATADSTDEIYTVNLIYRRNSDAKDSKIMTYNGSVWESDIGPFDVGDVISYYVSVTDNSGRRERSDDKSFVILGEPDVSRRRGFCEF